MSKRTLVWAATGLVGFGVMFGYAVTSTPLNGGWLIGIVLMSVAAYKLSTRKASK